MLPSDWLAGRAQRDEDILLQRRHSGRHEQLDQNHEPGLADPEPGPEPGPKRS